MWRSLTRPGRRRRVALNLVTLAVTVGFSYIALDNVRLGEVWRALRHSDYWWLVPAFGAFALANAARALRWHSLFTPGRRPPFGAVVNAMLIGYLFNNILPARAGEAARVVVLSQRGGARPAEVVGTVVVERIYDVVAILVIFFAAQPWLPHVSWFASAALAAAALAAGLIAATVVLAVYGDRAVHFVLRPLHRLPRLSVEGVERAGGELARGLGGLRHRGVALLAFLWTTVAWLLSGLSVWLVTRAFPLHLPLASGILIVVALGLAMILPSPPSAIGVFEAAALLGLEAYGISHTRALPMALVLHALTFIPFIVAGVLMLQHNARHPVAPGAVGPGRSA